MTMTNEDQIIWLALLRRHPGTRIYSSLESETDRSAWRDSHLMLDIERRKARHRKELMSLHVHGRIT